MEPGSPARDREIDTLRGFACILLVSYHVIGATLNDGLHVGTGPLRTGEDLLGMLRMPLFTFLSGYVYARAPIGTTSAWNFLRDKVRRLLVPMLFVGTALAAMHEWLPGKHGWDVQWKWLHILPVGHFWFVEALFLIFIVVLALERIGLLETRGRWFVCWLVAAALYLMPHELEWLAIGGAITLLPFFLVGLYCRRFGFGGTPATPGARHPARALVPLAAVVAIFVAAQLAGVESKVDTPVALMIGTASCVLLLFARVRIAPLAYVGAYSYTIYLFHVFFASASRIALTRWGVQTISVLFACGVLAGLLLPIVLDRILSRWRPARVLALGRR